MAGLLAGRVLTETFDRVTIIERDRLPEGPEARPGVPQSTHVHGLLVRGRQIISELFPKVEADLAAAGALNIDLGMEFPVLGPTGWFVRTPSDMIGLACSRGLLDWTIRRQFDARPQVRFMAEREVTRLLPTADGWGIGGVGIRGRGDQWRGEEELTADLVVDASGRHSKAPAWLAALGFTPPQESVVDGHLGYASRTYAIPPGYTADWKCIAILPTPPTSNRFGILIEIEGGRWVFSLMGGDGDYPPTDDAGFMEYTRSLRHPVLYEAIRNATPLSPIHGFRGTENRLRHYERLTRLPVGFVALGDAACAFNPSYGQGMTSAALGARTLRECLAEQRRLRPDGALDGLGPRFQKQLAKVIADPWMMATGADYKYTGTEGVAPSPVTKLINAYIDQVFALCTESAPTRQLFLEVQNMLKPGTAMFAPSVMAEVARFAWRNRTSRSVTTAPSMLEPA